ncbi:2854_t:CDS:1 [Gigaspora rosea]|nr:2854_t:CDS:1 [Gigaspora rosea]
MYENDFNKLVEETKTMKSQEEIVLLELYESFAGAQVQEGEYVGI